MKLELQHLAPYLPYGLKYRDAFAKEDRLIDFETAAYLLEDGVTTHKLIMLPLSDFYEKKGKGGKTLAEVLSDYDSFGDFHLKYDDIKLENIPTTDYRIIVALLRNHYDIFGLIDNNLAIKKD